MNFTHGLPLEPLQPAGWSLRSSAAGLPQLLNAGQRQCRPRTHQQDTGLCGGLAAGRVSITHICFVRGDLSELSSTQLAVFIRFFSSSGCFWSPFSQSTESAFSQKSLNPIIFKVTAWDLCSNQAQLAAWMGRCDLSLGQAPPSFAEPHAQLRPWAQLLMDVRKTQRWNPRSLTYTLFTALKLFGSRESIIDSWIMKNITQYSHYTDSKIKIMQFNSRVKYSFIWW